MKNAKNKNIIALSAVIIIIVGTLIFLFATGTINFNSNVADTNKDQKNANINESDLGNNNKENNGITTTDMYETFLNAKEYLNNFSEDEHGGGVMNVSYAYYDLNNDGVEELIVHISDGYDFGTHLFYTYVENKIKFIDKIYHFGDITYNKNEASIVYTYIRPSLVYGGTYGFYKLNNNKFELVKSVGVSIENGNEEYFVDDKTISKDEYNTYFDNNINFDFNELNN